MITKSDFNKICRICLELKNFNEMNQFSIDIKSMLQFCTNIQLNNNEYLPSQICNICLLNINKYYEFKKQCEHSELYLNQLLSNDNTTDKVDDKTWFQNIQIKNETQTNSSNVTTNIKNDDQKDFNNVNNYEEDTKDDNEEDNDNADNSTEEEQESDDDDDDDLFNDQVEFDKETEETLYNNKNKLLSKRASQIQWLHTTVSTDKCDINELLCKICNKTLAHIGSLARHMEIHESNRQYIAQCDKCNKGFYDQTNYLKHLERHNGQVEKHKCDKCDKEFYELSKLSCHLRTTHKLSFEYKCLECNKEYVLKEQYDLHIKQKHLHQKQYECTQCHKQYHLKHRLQKHIKNMHEKIYLCQICDKQYKSHTSLKNHTDRYHYNKHSNLFKQSCHLCGKIVLHMKRHMLVHNAARTFQCTKCTKSFLFNSDLVAHIKRVHAPVEAAAATTSIDHDGTVPPSSSTTSTNTTLPSSILLPYLCNICGKRRQSQSALEQHIIHAHTTEKTKLCTECNKYYKTDSALQRHIRFSHKNDRRFKCTVCTKVFYTNAMLRIHMRTHTGERPYQCLICSKAFVQSCTLKTHMKVHKGADQ